jgi:hypothetical protein
MTTLSLFDLDVFYWYVDTKKPEGIKNAMCVEIDEDGHFHY